MPFPSLSKERWYDTNNIESLAQDLNSENLKREICPRNHCHFPNPEKKFIKNIPFFLFYEHTVF